MNNKDYNIDALDNFISELKGMEEGLLNDIGDELINVAEESFQSRSYFGDVWQETILPSESKGTLVKSLDKKITGNFEISISSDEPYSKIQNEGGKIRVTDKMKKFFWAKFKSSGKTKWKGLATTKKVYLDIPARPYLKDTDELQDRIASKIRSHILKLNKDV